MQHVFVSLLWDDVSRSVKNIHPSIHHFLWRVTTHRFERNPPKKKENKSFFQLAIVTVFFCWLKYACGLARRSDKSAICGKTAHVPFTVSEIYGKQKEGVHSFFLSSLLSFFFLQQPFLFVPLRSLLQLITLQSFLFYLFISPAVVKVSKVHQHTLHPPFVLVPELIVIV